MAAKKSATKDTQKQAKSKSKDKASKKGDEKKGNEKKKKRADKQSQKQAQKQAEAQAQKQAEEQAQKQAEKLQEVVADNQSLEISFSWEKVEPVYNKKLQEMAQDLKLKGFRKGKVPTQMAEKKVDQEKLVNQVLQELLPEAYQEALKEGEHQPLTRPQFQAISVNKGNDWKLKAYFAEKPEVELKNYKKITQEAKKKAQKVIQQKEQELAKAKKEAQKDKDKKEKSAEKQEEKSQKKQNKQAKSKQSLPDELSDQQKKDMQVQMIFSKLVEELKPKVPEMLIRQNTERELQNLHQRLEKLNVSIEDYAQSQNLTKEQLTSQLALSSLNQLQVEFLLAEIAEEEGIKVTEKDIEEKIKQAEDESMQEKMRQDKRYQNYLKGILLKQKVISHLLNL